MSLHSRPCRRARVCAQEPSQFRSVEARTFSNEKLQRYGLSAEDASAVSAYQDAGYTVQTITAEEALSYMWPVHQRQWL